MKNLLKELFRSSRINLFDTSLESESVSGSQCIVNTKCSQKVKNKLHLVSTSQQIRHVREASGVKLLERPRYSHEVATCEVKLLF
jgi:hypothetical protein